MEVPLSILTGFQKQQQQVVKDILQLKGICRSLTSFLRFAASLWLGIWGRREKNRLLYSANFQKLVVFALIYVFCMYNSVFFLQERNQKQVGVSCCHCVLLGVVVSQWMHSVLFRELSWAAQRCIRRCRRASPSELVSFKHQNVMVDGKYLLKAVHVWFWYKMLEGVASYLGSGLQAHSDGNPC